MIKTWRIVQLQCNMVYVCQSSTLVFGKDFLWPWILEFSSKINLLPLIEVPISDVGAIQYQCIHNMDSIDSALSFALRNTWRKSVT